MMSHKDLPEGYAVVQYDGQWYPLKVERLYSAKFPNGFVALDTLSDGEGGEYHYPTRKQAVHACQEEAHENAYWEQRWWERLLKPGENAPDRCVHYREIIEEMTGEAPIVLTEGNDNSVIVYPPSCWICGHRLFSHSFGARTVEESLRAAAEWVYEYALTPCSCMTREIQVAS